MAAFNRFAWGQIQKVQDHYGWGKRPWYCGDDESRFVSALVELNYAGCVLPELSDEVRAVVTEWYTRLKSELNKAEYDGAMERFRLTHGAH